MIALTSATKIMICRQPTDMRKSFDTLAAIVRSAMNADPLDGRLYVFYNSRRNRVKILYWDHDGFAVWSKRLEKGCIRLPPQSKWASGALDYVELIMFLEGVSITGRKNRYIR